MPASYSRRVACFILLAGASLPLGTHSVTSPTPLARLTDVASRIERRIAPRLSISPRWRSEETHHAGGAEAATILATVRTRSPGPDALHVAGLVDLLWADSSGLSAGRAVASLEAALRLGKPSASLLADLSAAHLARAELAGTPLDLLAAIERAESALALQPRHPAARYNRALALDRLAVDGEAARAWRGFLAVDSSSAWADEARLRLRALSSNGNPAPPSVHASATELAAYTAREPQGARVFAMDRLLGEWGDAVVRGDSVRAEQRLRAAEAVAVALEQRGGDRSLADLVRSIHACLHNRDAVRRLAAAHAAYSRAQPALWNREAERAQREFDAALAGAEASPALRAWSSYLRGVALFYRIKGKEAEAAFRRSVAEVDTLRHPALAGRARWSLGTMLLRRGAFDASAPLLADAARLFERAGEREHLGGVRYLEAEARFGLGDEEAAYATMYRALHILRPYRGSLWLHNLLYVTSQAATIRGFNAASVRLQDEGVSVAARVRPAVHAEALLARAQARAAAGDSAGAAADLQTSRPKLEGTPRGYERSWYEETARLTAAMLSIRGRPATAAAELDSVVAYFSALQAPIRVLPALAHRAQAHLAAGQTAAATADLDSAAQLLDGLSMNVENAALRASILDAARGVFDGLAMAHARAGRPAAALAALERGRASFAAGTGAPRIGTTLMAPRGQVALEYALVGDTLLGFVVDSEKIRMVRRVVDRDALLSSVKRANTALEVPSLAGSAGRDLAALYDELVRPVSPYLQGGVPLVVVADGEIAAVPFAALRDTARGRYLIEDRPIRFASTLRDAARRAEAPASARRTALFVVDPAFEASGHPGLQRLPETASGARAIAAGYPRSVVLADTAADPGSLAAALGSAGVFHFAGHAVFDDSRPDRSYLVLAPGYDGHARLTAADLGGMDLRGLKLVVLSACQTQRSGRGRSGGFAGLSGALLAAGADGVIGSLWRVDDALTRPLMAQFHRAYRASGDAAGALRDAQLRLLHSPDPALRSPAAWGGFRYAGV